MKLNNSLSIQDDYPKEDDIPVTWTDNFVEALKSVVEKHVLAEDVNEPESISRRTVENILVHVAINVSNPDEFSQCNTFTLHMISASGYYDCYVCENKNI